MNWKYVEQISKSLQAVNEAAQSALPRQYYLSLEDVARLLGVTVKTAREFLSAQSVPYYRPVRAKLYFLPEVLDAIEKTRWQDKPIKKECVTS